ncbi:hypothetical protein [Luteitalea sp.]|uniref:hypothetical protein n=1 Tax=Luteitalea sp. TaxID=2004800 RepID=UPI0025BC0D87|nr:hypothetical protein [Luteitalea sp.]
MSETQTISSVGATGRHEDRGYHAFLDAVQQQFEGLAGPLFLVDVPGPTLWAQYLDGFAATYRQHHTCSACRQFVEQYAGLAIVAEHGQVVSALWTPDIIAAAPRYLQLGLQAMATAVASARIAGFFLTERPMLGKRVTGAWQHLALSVPAARRHTSPLLTAFQRTAERNEDYKTVSRAIGEFTAAQFETVVRVCQSEALYRSEKVLGQAEWLHALKVKVEAAPKPYRRNLVWQAVALAPAGFCHPRASMVGTLLDDVAAGLPFDTIKRRFDAKMHPLQYQRPQAAPTAGAIKQAEEVVAKLGIARSLQRRYATLADVTTWRWTPPVRGTAAPPTTVFGHLTPKGASDVATMVVQGPRLTWRKFAADFLPTADRLQVNLPALGHYITLTTAVDADAPPILQWDREDARNPAAWYVWHGGSSASQYGLQAGWADVVGITPKPSAWNAAVPSAHQGEAYLFMVAGAHETRRGGLAIFPETLRAELHGVRSVIEAFSNRGELDDVAGDHAIGLQFAEGSPVTVRVTSGPVITEHVIDRWE